MKLCLYKSACLCIIPNPNEQVLVKNKTNDMLVINCGYKMYKQANYSIQKY